MKKSLLFILLIIFFSLPALLPLSHEGFFTTDDGEWMIIRFSAFYSAFKDGQIPVRFLHSLNSGYGYPVPSFLYPGFMYLGIPIQIITSNFVTTIKVIFGLSLLGSALFTYFWLNKIFAKFAAFAGAIIALYLPYHLYDVYTRGSIGEVLALAFVPFTLWSIERKSIFFSSLGVALLLMSHNSISLLFIPLIIIYSILKIEKKSKNYLSIFKSNFLYLIFGAGLAAFFIIPAILELHLTLFAETTVADPFQYFANLKLIGVISLFTIASSLIIFFIKKNKIKKQKKFFIAFFIFSILGVFLSISLSGIIWSNISSSWIQFPFRTLSYLVVTLPFLFAYTADNLKFIQKYSFIVFVIALLLYSSKSVISPKEYIDKGEEFYYTNSATTTVQDEYLPVWVQQKPSKAAAQKVEILKGEGVIDNIAFSNRQISFKADLKKDSLLQINTIYWPGWSAYKDNNTLEINYNSKKGTMLIELPRGQHNIFIKFGESTLRLTANILSILFFIGLLVVAINEKKHDNYKK